MLFKLGSSNGKFDKLDPVAFKDFSNFGNLEKDLEELIAKSILDVLFEDAPLMPVFQERQFQAEADIYALNEKGELIIFELKRGGAGGGAVHNACPHCAISFPELSPQLFSFNSPLGMCPDCHGIGTQMQVDPDLIIDDETISVMDGALRWYGNVCKKKKFDQKQTAG